MTCEHLTSKDWIGKKEFTLPGGQKAIGFEGATGELLEDEEGVCGMAIDLTGGRFAVCPISRNPIKRAAGCILNPKRGQKIEIILPDDL